LFEKARAFFVTLALFNCYKNMKHCLLILLFPIFSFGQINVNLNLSGGVSSYQTDREVVRESEVYTDNFGLSFGLGINLIYSIDTSFSFGLGVGFHETNGVSSYKIKMDDTYQGQTYTTEINGVEYREVENMYRSEFLMQMPLFVRYKFKRWLWINGLQLSYQLMEKTELVYFNSGNGQWSEGNTFSHLRSWDLSYYVGAGFLISDKLEARLNISKGLRNIADRSSGYGGLIQRNQILFGISYSFLPGKL
jgi:hypothetical protein